MTMSWPWPAARGASGAVRAAVAGPGVVMIAAAALILALGGRGRFTLVGAAALLLAFAGCGQDNPAQPGGTISLPLTAETAPADTAAPAVGPVDTLEVEVGGPEGESLGPPQRAAVIPGTTRFQLAVAVTPGTGRSITLRALGSRPVSGGAAGSAPATARGILYIDRLTGLDTTPDGVDTLRMTLRLFVPRFRAPEIVPGSRRHTIHWRQVRWADHYVLRRSVGGGAVADTTLQDTTYTGVALPARYQVVAIDSWGGAGAPSDYLNALTPPPAAPSNLVGRATSPTRIELLWADNSTDEDGFELERAGGSSEDYARIATLAANTTQHGDSGLVENTRYRYRVRVFNANGASAWSAEDTVTTPQAPPPAPSELSATAVSMTRIDLTWRDNSTSETGFELQRRPPTTVLYQTIARPGVDVTSYTDTQVSGDETYLYRIRAVNGGGFSAWSEDAAVTTPPPPPGAPANLTAAADPAAPAIELAWIAAAGVVDVYEIERRSPGGVFEFVRRVPGIRTSARDGGLPQGVTFEYQVRARNVTGASAYSNVAAATTVLLAPDPPSDLAAEPLSATSIRLTWADNSDNESGFRLEQYEAGPRLWALVASVGANGTQFDHAGLDPATTHTYRVRSENATGVSEWTASASATTPQAPPAAPSGLAARATAYHAIELTWIDNSTNEAAFEIVRLSPGGQLYEPVDTVAAGTTAYADTALAEDSEYRYAVRAFNSSGASDYSNVASAVTPLAPPVNLAGTWAGGDLHEVRLTWVDQSNRESGFEIQRRTGAAAFAPIDTTAGPDVATYTDTVEPGPTYTYRVRAISATNSSAFSNEAVVGAQSSATRRRKP